MAAPTANDVADRLQRPSHSRSTGDAERVAWCHRFGLPHTGNLEEWSDPTGRSFGGPV
jgi:hypothetical protein